MAQIKFETDGENMPAVALAFYQSATIALRHMAKEKGNGPWYEALREEVKLSMKNGIPTGVHPDKEASFIKAALAAVDSVFDRIVWR